MYLANLLSSLGYSTSSNYNLIRDVNTPTLSPSLRRAARLNEEQLGVRVDGAYFFRTAPENENSLASRAAVFVAEAQDLKGAREIHRKLWNLNSAPFIIILLPNEIRVYSGFDYEEKNANQGLIGEPITIGQSDLFGELSQEVINRLRPYSAEAIDEGSIWETLQRERKFHYDNRVDKRLLRNLNELERALLSKLTKISKPKALRYVHALIGKYVYLRYLRDRDILSDKWLREEGIDITYVLTEKATLSELLKLDEKIEARFEGTIFPFPENTKDVLSDDVISYTASVFKGNEASGQRALFDVYDFSYIPVETLSFIYEQFLRAQNRDKKDGAVYTPQSLADYLINEVNVVTPLARGMKVLDPCCGSGIFLVLTYRWLIEQELRTRNVEKLAPDELKQIMVESIHGVERNLEACYVTEFSLTLTLLNYIEPPDLDKNRGFRFPNLHEKNIFEGDFFDDRKEFYPLQMCFEWIIGNPPWIEPKSDDIDEKLVLSWIAKNRKTRPVKGNRVAEAFAWRATEFVSDTGCVGFVLPASSLFSHESEAYRKAFFRQNEVRRISNFSNLRYLLFPKKVSAMTMIYEQIKPDQLKRPIWHFSPFAANQIAGQLRKPKPPSPLWAITLNGSEVKTITHEDAETGDAVVWKVAFWGTVADIRAIRQFKAAFPKTLEQLRKERGWSLSYGLQLRHYGVDEEIEAVDVLFEKFEPHWKELDAKKLHKSGYKFHIPKTALKKIPPDKRYVRIRGGKKGYSLIKHPHLVVNPNYAIYSDKDFVITDQNGIAAPPRDKDYLRAISVYLSSNIARYVLFFTSHEWGISHKRITPKELKILPVPPLTDRQIEALANLQIEFAKEEEDHDRQVLKTDWRERAEQLQEKLDARVTEILKIPSSLKILASDFINVQLSLNEGKVTDRGGIRVPAVRVPTKNQLKDYALRLRRELDAFARTGEIRHSVSVVSSSNLIVCTIKLVKTNDVQRIEVLQATNGLQEQINNLRNALRQKFNQWIYIQREARFFDARSETAYICKAPRLIDWTETQAIYDANEVIGDVVSQQKVEVELA